MRWRWLRLKIITQPTKILLNYDETYFYFNKYYASCTTISWASSYKKTFLLSFPQFFFISLEAFDKKYESILHFLRTISLPFDKKKNGAEYSYIWRVCASTKNYFMTLYINTHIKVIGFQKTVCNKFST